MKKVLKALAKTLGIVIIATAVGLAPVVLGHLVGPLCGLAFLLGLCIVFLFYVIYKSEK